MATETLTEAVDQWRTSADRVLDLAAAAAPQEIDTLESLSLDAAGPAIESPVSEAVFAAEIDRLLADSETATGAAVDDGGASRAMAVLVGTMSVSASVLAASEPPDEALLSFGVDSDGTVSVTGQKTLLDELRRTLFGEPPPGVPLPPGFGDQLHQLEVAGTDELVATVRESVLWEAFSGVLSTAQALDRTGLVTQLIGSVGDGLGWLKRQGLRIVAWTLEKFAELVPESFRARFDEVVADLKEKLDGEVDEALPRLIGALFGRLTAEDGWARVPEGTERDEQALLVPDIVAAHLERIGQASSLREGALKVVGVLRSAALLPAFVAAGAAVAPYLSAAIVALAAAVVAFVGYQMWDGFNDVESLATPLAVP